MKDKGFEKSIAFKMLLLVILERNMFSSSWPPFFHLYCCQLRFFLLLGCGFFVCLFFMSLGLVKIGFKSKFEFGFKKKRGFCVKPSSLLISVLFYSYLNLGLVFVGLLYVGLDFFFNTMFTLS